MPEPLDVVVVEVPARIADLAFRISIPHDWKSHELPEEDVDFSSPSAFVPLLLAAAPWAAVVLTVAARPGFEDGTLQDWSLFLLASLGVRPTAFGPSAIGNMQGLVGVGRQQQDDTWFEFRFAFFEDGGRLVQLGLFAPETISSPLEPIWRTALQTFLLERPQGQRTPLGPGLGIVPQPSVEAESDSPVAEKEESRAPEPSPVEPPEPEPEPTRRQFTDSDLGYYAKADDLATLDPENTINARLRNQGVGFVPNVLESDLAAKTATLGAGAIQAVIRVALGWYVNDDGRRTLVLDPDGKIQVSLQVISKNGRSVDQMLDDIQDEAVQSYPNPEFLRLQDQGIWALAIRNINVDGQPVEQAHMLTRWAKDSAMLRARVTADPPSMRFAVDFADLILKSAEYGAEPGSESAEAAGAQADEPGDGPEWVRRARKLEREDRLEEMEQLMRDQIQSLHCAISIAEMYRLRWIRLQQSDPVKAAAARKQAADWARTYASWATSGGEGAALSRERDEFLRQLGPEPVD